MPKLVSLVIPAYNSADYINHILDDLRLQTYDAMELVVIDDGSEDGTEGVVRRAIGLDPRIKLLSQDHRGVSAARNTGLANCSGDYIGFLDADDRADPRYVELMVNKMSDEKTALAVCGWDRGTNSEGMIPQPAGACAARALLEDGAFFTPLWNKLFARTVIFSNSGFTAFDEALAIGEDEEWAARVLLCCETYAVVPEVLYHWLPREDSASAYLNSLNARALTEVHAKRNVYGYFSQREDLEPPARRRYIWSMRALLVEGYRADREQPAYQELLSEYMAATEKVQGGGLTLVKSRAIGLLISCNAPLKLIEWVGSL